MTIIGRILMLLVVTFHVIIGTLIFISRAPATSPDRYTVEFLGPGPKQSFRFLVRDTHMKIEVVMYGHSDDPYMAPSDLAGANASGLDLYWAERGLRVADRFSGTRWDLTMLQ